MNITKMLAVSISIFFSCLAFTMQEESIAAKTEDIEQKELENEIKRFVENYIAPKLGFLIKIVEIYNKVAEESADDSELCYNEIKDLERDHKFFIDNITRDNLFNGKDNSAYIKLLVIDEVLDYHRHNFYEYLPQLKDEDEMNKYTYECPEKYEHLLEDPWFKDEREIVGIGRWRELPLYEELLILEQNAQDC